jgi:Holliday junction resolvase RusA-like endonuclease
VISFVVDGKPQGKERARFVNGHAYTPKKTRDYEEYIRISYLASKGKKLYGNIRLSVRAYFPIPKSVSKSKRKKMLEGEIKHDKKPDLSNIFKAIEDALNGIAYEDDSKITDFGPSFKRYSDTPRVEVDLEVV